MPDSSTADAGDAPPGHAVLSAELRDADRVVWCGAGALLRGSLSRRGVPVVVRSRMEVRAGPVVVFSVPVAGCEGTELFAGASRDVWEAVRQSVMEWASVMGPRTVLLAAPRPCPAGTRRADEITQCVSDAVYVHGVAGQETCLVDELAQRGAFVVDGFDAVPRGATVVFAVNGLPAYARGEALRRGLVVVDSSMCQETTGTAPSPRHDAAVVHGDKPCGAGASRRRFLRTVIEDADLLLVVDRVTSPASARLVELVRRRGTPAHLVDSADGILPDWIRGARTIGLTAGSPAALVVVNEVVSAISGLGPTEVLECAVPSTTV
ncbi:4-hydroxy-3-methylbut-2-enyl diphosphate reductase [Lentzea fradiae]|uniref:4-hydroxy-3-methylbut-2-enyl diphosphate reductase n=2 Tax=Lentzea fradiae TaxID=200378 RepID=A0A1G8CM54_9PSEU|nr:4-hydroxy-3-methylbut-2-enyl diphosphate reductase [Lentzea fradiae]